MIYAVGTLSCKPYLQYAWRVSLQSVPRGLNIDAECLEQLETERQRIRDGRAGLIIHTRLRALSVFLVRHPLDCRSAVSSQS